MIRFALVAASTLGFMLTAALCSLLLPLRGRPKLPPPKKQDAAPERTDLAGVSEDAVSLSPARPPAFGGLCLMLGALAAAGVGWTAACVAQPQLLEGGVTSRLLAGLCGGLAFGAVGAADDLVRLRRRQPLGLRRGPRLLLEAGAAALVMLLLRGTLPTGVLLPFGGYWELGALAPVVWGGGLVALAECARSADGADGTVCGAGFIAMLGLMTVLTILGWFALGVFPAALAGALMAFLLWNFPPARMAAGTAGSLFVAGAIGCISLSAGYPELAVPLALPFWLEGGMVALQILSCKLRGRPLFATAPWHHWLEKRGKGPVSVFYWLCAAALLGLWMAVQMTRWA